MCLKITLLSFIFANSTSTIIAQINTFTMFKMDATKDFGMMQ